jgi:heme oxygenase (biliverdin-IX-beta and delta-forming)
MSMQQRGQVHNRLRRATATAHRELDHHPLLQRLLGPDLTRDQYAESLAALYRPHVQLERLVHDSPHHAESGFELTARIERLEADLRELGWFVPRSRRSRRTRRMNVRVGGAGFTCWRDRVRAVR